MHVDDTSTYVWNIPFRGLSYSPPRVFGRVNMSKMISSSKYVSWSVDIRSFSRKRILFMATIHTGGHSAAAHETDRQLDVSSSYVASISWRVVLYLTA